MIAKVVIVAIAFFEVARLHSPLTTAIETVFLPEFQFLYLEGNLISSLPEDLFDCLPNLRWLDLRNNHISEIPQIIGTHRFVC